MHKLNQQGDAYLTSFAVSHTRELEATLICSWNVTPADVEVEYTHDGAP